MKKPGKRSPAVSEKLRLFGNPYYSLQIDDEEPSHAHVSEPREFRDPTPDEVVYLRRLGNQYAKLSVTLITDESQAANVELAPERLRGISKRDFEKECTRILRQYMGVRRRGRLDEQYQSFISRNAGREPRVRLAVLSGLRRFDLSNVPGIEGRFHRERDPVTERKLERIELDDLSSIGS